MVKALVLFMLACLLARALGWQGEPSAEELNLK